jgi:hypothetical protein
VAQPWKAVIGREARTQLSTAQVTGAYSGSETMSTCASFRLYVCDGRQAPQCTGCVASDSAKAGKGGIWLVLSYGPIFFTSRGVLQSLVLHLKPQ